jgi:hypothetical protein
VKECHAKNRQKSGPKKGSLGETGRFAEQIPIDPRVKYRSVQRTTFRKEAPTSAVTIYARSDRRFSIVWTDEKGRRRDASRRTLEEAKSYQSEILAGIERHREGRFTEDDRSTYDLARQLAGHHGYTVLQAVQEWANHKGRIDAKSIGKCFEEFILTKKANRCKAYTDRLEDDLRLFLRFIGYNRRIDEIRSDDIEESLDQMQIAGRRRNNLRGGVVTLFRHSKTRLRALPRDRVTEAELVQRDEVQRKAITAFTPAELELLLGAVSRLWLPWLALGALSGIRTGREGEIPRVKWEYFKWDRRLIDLPPEVTKLNQRRSIPICDRLFELLHPIRQESGSVLSQVDPGHEIARLKAATGIKWRQNALRHSYCSYRVAITGNVELTSLESGNSPAMIRRCYLDLKDWEEGIAWFGLTIPVPQEKRHEPFLRPLISFG